MQRDREEMIKYAKRKSKRNKECTFETLATFRRGRCAYCGSQCEGRTCQDLCSRAFDGLLSCLNVSSSLPICKVYLPPYQLLSEPARETFRALRDKRFTSCVGVISGNNTFRFFLNDREETTGELELISHSVRCANCDSAPSKPEWALELPGPVRIDSFCSPLCRTAFACLLRRAVGNCELRCTEIYPMYSLELPEHDRILYERVKCRDDYLTRNVVQGNRVLIDVSVCR